MPSEVATGDKPQAVWLSDGVAADDADFDPVAPGDQSQAGWLSNEPEYDEDAFADPTWNTVNPGPVFDHQRASVWLEQHGQHRRAATIRRHGIRLEANRRVEAIRGTSPAPMMLEAEPRVGQVVATPRERRARRASTSSRGSPDGDSEPGPPPPLEVWRGIEAASARMVQPLRTPTSQGGDRVRLGRDYWECPCGRGPRTPSGSKPVRTLVSLRAPACPFCGRAYRP
jgi:hypothetical protein